MQGNKLFVALEDKEQAMKAHWVFCMMGKLSHGSLTSIFSISMNPRERERDLLLAWHDLDLISALFINL